MSSWEGKPIAELIDQWGPPTRVTPDGRGGMVYIWEQYKRVGNGCIASRMFWVDSTGIIYKWAWKGL